MADTLRLCPQEPEQEQDSTLEEVLPLELRRAQRLRQLFRWTVVALLATAAALALVPRGSRAPADDGMAKAFSLPEGSLPWGVVGLSQDMVVGALSSGVDVKALRNGGAVSTLTGCCPTEEGKFLECCSFGRQCCPSEGGMYLSCCPQFRPTGGQLQTCVGSNGHTVCPKDAACCNGLCCGEQAVCCGAICCGKESTCCKDIHGAYVCGAPGSACGGEYGGAPLHWSNWPNPATPKEWQADSQKEVTVFREEPDRGNLVKCDGVNGRMICLQGQLCCDGLCCGADAVCCGNICCGPRSTCCRNKFGAHTCGAEGSVCGGPIGGAPMAPKDWPNPSAPKNWEDPNEVGITVYRYEPSEAPRQV